MQKDRERWLELAELAADEQDPNKLLALVNEINALLDKKQKRLQGPAANTPAETERQVPANPPDKTDPNNRT
jgi:hypothetical protein